MIAADAGIKTIGEFAFYETALSEITIPASVQRIETQAFLSCNSLHDVTIEKGVKYIGEGAFSWCDELKEIRFTGTAEEWDAIEKDSSWTDIKHLVVDCTDAMVEY